MNKRKFCYIEGYPVSLRVFLTSLPFIMLIELCGRKIAKGLDIACAKKISKLLEKE